MPMEFPVKYVNKSITGTISGALLVITGIGAPIARVVYEESTGKLGAHIAPYTLTENWNLVKRTDLSGESLTPEQGKEVMGATINTILMAAPIKSPIAVKNVPQEITDWGAEQSVSTLANLALDLGMDKVTDVSNAIKQNLQKVGNVTFDSNKARQSDNGNLIVTDIKTGKDYGVTRNEENGSYNFSKGN